MTTADNNIYSRALLLLQRAIGADNADRGNIQYYNKTTGALHILVHQGFEREFLEYFSTVKAFDPTACGRSMGIGRTVLIEDVNEDKGFAKHRQVAKNAGFRAVKSTPIFGENKDVVGVLSTHFSEPKSNWSAQDNTIATELSELFQSIDARAILHRCQ